MPGSPMPYPDPVDHGRVNAMPSGPKRVPIVTDNRFFERFRPVTQRRSIEEAFSPRHNSLNALRLVLATMVIFSHSFALSGDPGGEIIVTNKTSIGNLAVFGFFAISGFLIAKSATRTNTIRYLWQRFLRIFPAFWFCLIVTAFALGLVSWDHDNPQIAQHCGVSCYVGTSSGPFGYIFHNLWLWVYQPGITNTLRHVPFLPLWDGSLWSLPYEFLCYLMLGALALAGALKHRRITLLVSAAVGIVLVTVTSVPSLNSQVDYLHNLFWMNLLQLVPIFLAGSLLYLYRKEVPDSGWLALGCAALLLTSLLLPLGNGLSSLTLTSFNLAAPLLVYPLIWLGIHLPLQKVGARNDYSYGIYIYGFPVQQLLAMWGVYRWGYWSYSILAVAMTVPFAVISWWVVEKHALRLKKIRLRSPAELSPDAALLPSGADLQPSGADATAVLRTSAGERPALPGGPGMAG
jgi:peptidoglycan/LPS O-acetylase OafA/YrhL